MSPREEFKDLFTNTLPRETLKARADRVRIAAQGVLDLVEGKLVTDEHGTALDKLVCGAEELMPDLAPVGPNEIKRALLDMPGTSIKYGAEQVARVGRTVVEVVQSPFTTSEKR